MFGFSKISSFFTSTPNTEVTLSFGVLLSLPLLSSLTLLFDPLAPLYPQGFSILRLLNLLFRFRLHLRILLGVSILAFLFCILLLFFLFLLLLFLFLIFVLIIF